MLRASPGLAALLLVGCVQTFGLDDPELEGAGNSPTPPACNGTVANGSCYEWNAGPVAWTVARDRCASQGHLAKTESPTALQVTAALVYPGTTAWLGASNGTDFSYEWVDGSAVSGSAWLPFSPDDLAGQCMTMANYGTAAGWENTSCGDALPYICQRPF